MPSTILLSDNGAISGISGYQLTGGTDGTLTVQTTTSGGTPTTAVSIDNTQNTTVAGNLTLSGTGKRITGDFSNSTQANKVMFQSSTTNANTNVGLLPNGTAVQTVLQLHNNADPTNAGIGQLITNTTDISFRSAITGTGSYLPMTFYTGGSERMRVDTSGNVGIGTSSPSSFPGKLSVIGDGIVTDYDLISRVSSSLADADRGFKQLTDGTGQFSIYSPNGGGVVFGVGSSYTERMRIDSSGNVGIGTSSFVSGAKLDVRGPIVANYGANGLAYSATNGANSDFEVHIATNLTTIKNTGSVAGLAFGTNNTERMRIDSSGNLLLGLTSGSSKFVVFKNNSGRYDNSNIEMAASSGNITLGFHAQGASAVTLRHVRATSSIQVRSTNDDAFAPIEASAFTVGSDYRLKENITPINGAIERLLQLPVYRFNFKPPEVIGDNYGDKTVDGFLAHEVAEVVPEAVFGEKDAVDDEGKPKYQSIDQSKLVPLLTAAIQEQQAIITQQAEAIASLQADVAALKGA